MTFDPTLPYCTSIGLNETPLSTSYTVPRFTLPKWRLPEPLPGRRWHREDWTQDMLPEGWRPLLDGENVQAGDEWHDAKDSWFERDFRGSITPQHQPTRTRRPLPDDGWLPHHSGECPVPPETVVNWRAHGATSRDEKTQRKAGELVWFRIAEYRIVSAPDPLASVRAAHAAGKTVQCLERGRWFDDKFPDWQRDVQWRVKPEPRYVAWDFNSRPRDVTWVCRKGFLTDSMITAWGDDVMIIATKHGPVPQSYTALLNDWMQRDGSPCGKQVTD